MVTAAANLNLYLQSYNNSQEMEYQLHTDQALILVLAGLQFPNSLANNDTLPTDLEVAIR